MTMYSPRICYANKITNAMITTSSNTDTKTRLIDRNDERRWVAIGEAQSATITVALTEAIDTIAILNTNASQFTIKIDGGDFTPAVSNAISTGETFNIVDSANAYLIDNSSNFIVSAGNALRVYNNYYFKVSEATASTSIVISVTATMDGNAVKVGQVVMTKQIHEITSGGSGAVVAGMKQIQQEMSDGTLNKIYVRGVKGYDLTLNNATPQERAQLQLVAEINRRDALFYIHRPAMYADYFDGLCGHVNWVNALELDDYYNNVTRNGFTGKIELRQASGIQ